MLIYYSNDFTLKSIKSLCKIKGIKYIFNCKKSFLLELLKKFNAAIIIQKNIRTRIMPNDICPISHEPLKYPFVSIKVNNKFFYYDFYTFIEYLNKTQDFRDPCTRHLINDTKLIQINKLIRYYYGKSSNKILISKTMIKNTDLHIITFCLHDIVKEIENKELTLEETYNNIMPRFMYYINYLIRNHSHEDAEIILKACEESIDNGVLLDYLKLIEIINY